MNATRHTFDLADWCIVCGAGRADVVEGRRNQHCDVGVTGISHIRTREAFLSRFRAAEAQV